MKKINPRFNQKDRVVCVTNHDRHEFYYQPVETNKRILLFMTNGFSNSVYSYFHEKGTHTTDGYSLTVRELYEYRRFYNVKLANVISRIPTMIEYVLREHYDVETPEKKKDVSHIKKEYNIDREIAV